MSSDKKKILFIDTETGGINPKETSLLSIGLVAWENGNILDKKEFYIKHDLYRITPQAISINKINLVDFIQKALAPEAVISQILKFIDDNFHECKGNIVIGGHNTNFDINFLKEFLHSNGIKFESIFSHRFIDTASIIKFLYYADKLPQDISSSDEAFRFFNIDIENRHTALDDAFATANLFNSLLKLNM